jgi:IPTL-CTERM motif
MRVPAACTFARSVLALSLLALSSGCNSLGVEMTSTPDSVRRGDPVMFDIKLTNRSQCPLTLGAAELIAFIPVENFFELLFEGEIPPDAPPEVLEFVEEVRRFFDELCSGGEPQLPEPPMLATSCSRGPGEIVCELSRPLSAQQGSSGSMTFAGVGDRLRCEVDGGTMRCRLRIALPNGSATANATVAAAVKPLTCLTDADFGGDLEDVDALCFIGTFPAVEGLGPNEMATGQVTLAARGSGTVRNLVIAITNNDADLGVCKGGSAEGEACDMEDVDPCPGGSCGAGICLEGANDGLGCDEATAMMDCPDGTCKLCADVAENGFLPIDCTTTIIAAEPVPTLSPWGLMALAAVLLAFGLLWSQRRRGGRAQSQA